MADRWMVTIEVWPHSTGKGQEIDQAAVGSRQKNFVVRSEGMAAALELAECIAQGIRANPMVWRAPIVAIVQEQEAKRRCAMREKPSIAPLAVVSIRETAPDADDLCHKGE